mmetsp:Transcript_36733/g.86253  ORF Transcript_36733/g.86253 Transcript_36733/m.86253 type:complete len:86 (-) Transcript_36733:647-904(-)
MSHQSSQHSITGSTLQCHGLGLCGNRFVQKSLYGTASWAQEWITLWPKVRNQTFKRFGVQALKATSMLLVQEEAIAMKITSLKEI